MLMNFSVICSMIVHSKAKFSLFFFFFLYYRLHVMPLIHARTMPSCMAVVLIISLTPDIQLCRKHEV